LLLPLGDFVFPPPHHPALDRTVARPRFRDFLGTAAGFANDLHGWALFAFCHGFTLVTDYLKRFWRRQEEKDFLDVLLYSFVQLIPEGLEPGPGEMFAQKPRGVVLSHLVEVGA